MNKKQQSKKSLLVNSFGGLGYITCLMLWGWTGIIYVPMILENEQLERLLLPNKNEEIITPVASSVDMSPIAVFFALMVAALVLVATVVMLLRAPVAIARTGKTVTTKAAGSALPLITRGKTLPAAKKKRLTASLVKLAKLLLILLPITVLSIGMFVELPLSLEIIALISGVLALMATAWFSAQYIFAHWFGIKPEQLI